MRMIRIALATAIVITLTANSSAQAPSPAQDFIHLLSNNLRGWVVKHPGRDHASVSDETMVVANDAGMVHTENRTFHDFELRFDTRALDNSTDAVLALFGWDWQKDTPISALGVPLLHAALAQPNKVDFASLTLNVTAVEKALKPNEEWQSYEVVRGDYALTVRLNTHVIAEQYVSPAQDGWIGVQTSRGRIALRNIRVASLPNRTAGQLAPDFPGAYRPGNGVKLPQLVTEVRPAYTSDAMRAKIQGSAAVECVVQTDGSVGEARIVRSLDPRFGLDAEALKAAKRWRFRPGTKDDNPVPVVIVIQLSFSLK